MSKNKKIGSYIKLTAISQGTGISYYKLTQYDKGVTDALTKSEIKKMIKFIEKELLYTLYEKTN